MKLIRVKNPIGQSTSIFTASLNQDLLVEKNSKIALKNIIIEKNPSVFVVNNNVNTFQIKFASGDATFRDVIVKQGLYSQTELMSELEKALRIATVNIPAYNIYANASLGFVFYVNKHDDVFPERVTPGLSIAFSRDKFNTNAPVPVIGSNLNIATASGGVGWEAYKRIDSIAPIPAGTPSFWDAYAILQKDYCQANGYFMMTGGSNLRTAEESSWIIGLVENTIDIIDYTTTSLSSEDPVTIINKISFGLYINNDRGGPGLGTLQFIHNGEIDTNPLFNNLPLADLTNNKYILFQSSKGKIEIFTTPDRVTNPTSLMNNTQWEDFDVLKRYKIAYWLKQNDDRLYIRPTVTNPDYNKNYGYSQQQSFQYNNIGASSSLVSIQFPNTQTANFWGYSNNLLVSDTGANYIFNSTLPLTGKQGINGFMLSIDNFRVDSYDTYTKTQQNIISTVPFLNEREDGLLYYEPSVPIFLSLHNKEDFVLREFSLRLTDMKTGKILDEQQSVDCSLLITNDPV